MYQIHDATMQAWKYAEINDHARNVDGDNSSICRRMESDDGFCHQSRQKFRVEEKAEIESKKNTK